MKMWKKAASIALVSALTVSMAACGNGGGSDKGSADADTFKIGGIGPTTGDAAIYGTAVQNGIQLAIDEINEAGGINGYQIEFKFEPYFEQKDGITVLNPGSLAYPRQEGRKGSYMIMEIDQEGKAHFNQKYLD